MKSEAFHFAKSFEHSPKVSKPLNHIVFNDSNVKNLHFNVKNHNFQKYVFSQKALSKNMLEQSMLESSHNCQEISLKWNQHPLKIYEKSTRKWTFFYGSEARLALYSSLISHFRHF